LGYGANPNECVELVIGSGAEVLVGNHDHAATAQLDVQYFNDYARVAILWTREALTARSLEYLKGLPFVITHPGIRLVHSSPSNPADWEYVLSLSDAARQFAAFDEPICFIGHSHYPGLFRLLGSRTAEIDFPDNEAVILTVEARHLVNVGSVGQPRDNDPRGAWVLYDNERRELTLKRVDYAVKDAQAKILGAGMPAFLAARLEVGI
jgi:diadenosine tetraphosphatase ApaH/serine/threonine PP2A family protein phosphatase